MNSTARAHSDLRSGATQPELGKPSTFARLTPAAPLRPVDPKARIDLVDAVRGLAVFGILWVNVFMRSDPLQLGALASDRDALSWAVAFTGTLKFRSMFAFLFGVGLAIQAGRAGDDPRFPRVYLRRLGVLLCLGALHVALFWPGDILIMYALCGAVLVWFRRAPERVLFGLGLVFLVAGMGQQILGMTFFDKATLRAEVASAYVVYGGGSFAAVTAQRVHDYLGYWTPALWVTFPMVFAMMVFGLLVGRRRLFGRADQERGRWRRLCAIGFAVGVPLNALYATWTISASRTPAFTWAAKSAHALGAPFLCIAYVATIVLLWRSARGQRFLAPLAAVGRMSLTAYLGHSVVCSLLFYGYGLGWFGHVTKGQDVVICCALFALELAFANAWFLWFRMGPVEWVWRWATYGARPAMLRARVPAPAMPGAVGP